MRLYSRPDCPAQRKRNRNQVTDKKICHWSFFGVVSGQDKNSVQYGTFTFVANYSDFTTYSLYNRIYNNERGKKKIIPSRLRQRQASRPTVDAAQGYLSGLKCSFSPEI